MGYRKIGIVLKVSENKAFRIVRNLIKLGIIEASRQKPRLLIKDGGYMKDIPNDRCVHIFSYKGGVYEQEANSYSFAQFPIHLYKIPKKRL
jgi:hypothetical protein